MAASHLPDDRSRWPSDPFELLGIDRRVDERQLKRAYAALIRHYKPEQFPDEFQKIRAAFENARQILKWKSAQASSASDDVITGFQDASILPAEAPGPFQSKAVKPEPTAWDNACAGDLLLAYRQLCELPPSERESDEIAVQLYWLLSLDPLLDSSRKPVDWISSAFQRSGQPGFEKSTQLLLREQWRSVGRIPPDLLTVALDNRWTTIELQVLFRNRWPTLARLDAWALLLNELGQVETVFFDDHAGWLAVNMQALELASRSSHQAAFALVSQIRKNFQACHHLALSLTWLFDQAELEFHLAEQLRKLRLHSHISDVDELRPLIESLCELRQTHPHRLRYKLMPLINGWLDDFTGTLNDFDQLMAWQAVLMSDLIRAIETALETSPEPDVPMDNEDLAELVERQTRLRAAFERDFSRYGEFRRLMMMFCLQELVPVDAVFAHLQNRSGLDPQRLRQKQSLFYGDLPLRALLKGHLLFWT